MPSEKKNSAREKNSIEYNIYGKKKKTVSFSPYKFKMYETSLFKGKRTGEWIAQLYLLQQWFYEKNKLGSIWKWKTTLTRSYFETLLQY